MESAQEPRPAPSPPTASLLIGGSLAIALLFSFRFNTLALLVDDAFITFRYAETLATQGELVFNLGERVEGYSNLSWTLLLALGSAGGVAPTTLAPVLGYLLGIATLALVAGCLSRALECPLEFGLVAAGLVAMQPAWCFWTGAGLETPLFAGLLLGLWVATSFVEGWRGTALAATLACALALTRPEGALFSWLVVPGLILRGASASEVGAATVLLVSIVVAHVAWRLSYYGVWVPTPVLAKSALGLAGIGRGLAYLWSYVWHEGVLFVLPLYAFSPRRKELLSLGLLVLGYTAFVVVVGGDGLYRHRLLAHVTPLVIVGAAVGAWEASSRPSWRRAVVVLGVLGNLVLPQAQSGFFRQHSLADVRDWEERWEEVGMALHSAERPCVHLATNVVGRVPYYSKLETLDLLGLTDPVIAATPVENPGRGYAGHERAAPQYVLKRAPDIIYLSVLDGMPFEAFRRLDIVRGVLARGSLYRYAALVNDPQFAQRYAPALLPLRDGRTANLFVKREGRSTLLPQGWSLTPRSTSPTPPSPPSESTPSGTASE